MKNNGKDLDYKISPENFLYTSENIKKWTPIFDGFPIEPSII